MGTITINGKKVEFTDEKNVLTIIRKAGFEVPTLCYQPELSIFGACRLCMVEDDRGRFFASCSEEPRDGMVIYTHTERLRKNRKLIVELLLAAHCRDCTTCDKHGRCKLQKLAYQLGINNVRFENHREIQPVDFSSPAIVRDPNKCILCGCCVRACSELQGIGVLAFAHRGTDATVTTAFDRKMAMTNCVSCGQCRVVCPTGALTIHHNMTDVWQALGDKNTRVVAQIAPAVRVAIGEAFGLPKGENSMGKVVAALHRMGFDEVFDTAYTADLTIMEEGSELLDRLSRYLNGDKEVCLPILTSCCPAWVNFFEHQFPDMLDIPSTARSPQQMFGAIAKNYWAEKMNIPREDLIVVSIMPCLAKKYECAREEFATQGDPDVNYSLSTRELASLIKRANIDFNSLADEDFDHPLGESTGAGVIFGASGGVMEAALRTAYELYTGKTLDKVDFKEVRGLENIKKATIKLNGVELHVGIAHGLGNARKLLNEIREGKSEFHAIEIMACPGGCIGGGGQPLHHGNSALLKARSQAIYQEDEHKPLRKSHENPDIIKLYEEYLGKPLSEKAHHLLHTHYFNKATIN